CVGNGVCIGGPHDGAACADCESCPAGVCKHCVPQGGAAIPGDDRRTCAANCTFETSATVSLKSLCDGVGVPLPPQQECGVFGDTMTSRLGVMSEGQQTVSLGKSNADGSIPLTVRAASVKYPAVAVQNLACVCVRGAAAKTCGGTRFESDG